MKVPLSSILILLCAFSLLLVPVTAITTGTGNTPGIQPTGVILTSDPYICSYNRSDLCASC